MIAILTIFSCGCVPIVAFAVRCERLDFLNVRSESPQNLARRRPPAPQYLSYITRDGQHACRYHTRRARNQSIDTNTLKKKKKNADQNQPMYIYQQTFKKNREARSKLQGQSKKKTSTASTAVRFLRDLLDARGRFPSADSLF